MVQAIPEVPESQAEGKTKSMYDDIKSTLRVPAVPPIFLALGHYPNYLVTAWTALKPNAQTVYFERQADALRRTAVDAVSALGQPNVPSDSLLASIQTLHYTEPIAFLAAAALRNATNGAQPRMQYLSAEEKRQLSPGVPPGAASLQYADLDSVDERSRAVLEEIAATPGAYVLGTEYRTLAAAPDALETVWATIRGPLARPEYAGVRRLLHRQTDSAVSSMPFRMDIHPHVLRHSGLSEIEIDGVREVLRRFDEAGAATVVNVALLAVAALGTQVAAQSPFAATA